MELFLGPNRSAKRSPTRKIFTGGPHIDRSDAISTGTAGFYRTQTLSPPPQSPHAAASPPQLRRQIPPFLLLFFFSSMAGAARGRGGRGGSPPRKLARHDAEAGSSSRPAVEPWRSKQPRDRDRLSRNGGRSPWAGFHELDAALFPHIKRCREADAELVAAERAVAAGEEGAADRLAAAKDEHALANACRKSAEKFNLGIDE